MQGWEAVAFLLLLNAGVVSIQASVAQHQPLRLPLNLQVCQFANSSSSERGWGSAPLTWTTVSRKRIVLGKKQGATDSFNSERHTQIQRFAVDLITQQCVPFHVNILCGCSRKAGQPCRKKEQEWAEELLTQALEHCQSLCQLSWGRKGSSRLLLALSHIHSTEWLPCDFHVHPNDPCYSTAESC